MFEKVLHGSNIAAAFAAVATTADLTIAALSGVAIYKSADGPVRTLAKQMAGTVDTALAKAHMTDARKRIVAQMLAQYQPDTATLVSHNLNADAIAEGLCQQISDTAKDPAHKAQGPAGFQGRRHGHSGACFRQSRCHRSAAVSHFERATGAHEKISSGRPTA